MPYPIGNETGFYEDRDKKYDGEEDDVLPLPKVTSSRLVKLIDSNLLPDIKRSPSKDIIIRKGLLVELYKHGVTREQLPNLKALGTT